ncbi:hypothetical protein TSAR_010769 [Trichomalopsis sarcophagae]|uniref:Pre-rRNA-processing protein Ipi1 N-terminal domain-containing protein n=1 Tax=Trichomalopsis sarcophagae TaxID=543379 RepID=A0A232FCM9_9HYME|nr:hypothetical protein TSAR_010769 [Trichomalopsis sarcophagae]
MGKNHRHQKQLKSEKAKVKLKTKGTKQPLPKGLNITDASFKVKKIVIREQLKQQDATQILSRRKLNVKDLLTRLQHYNSTVRQDAIRELKDILSQHAADVLNVQLNELLKGIAGLVLDKEKAIRREALKALNLVLSPVSKDQLLPFCNILISYLTCAMTHIDHNIMEDSLLFLDILIQHCNSFLADNSQKILLYFLDMISKLRSQAQPGRQLTTNLNSKSTSMKWRIKVLNSLQQFLLAIVQNKKNAKANTTVFSSKVYQVQDKNGYYPIYTPISLQTCPINVTTTHSYSKINKSLDLEALQNYIDLLMPLMFDSWIEVSPKSQNSSYVQLPISEEAACLLRCITSIIQSIIEYLELLEKDNGTVTSSTWFKSKYQNVFIKNLLQDFPYVQQKSGSRAKKSQVEITISSSGDCLEQNLTLSYIYIWFTTISSNIKTDKLDQELSLRVLQFITDKLEKWNNNQTFAVPYLIKALRVLFLKANKIWYKNKVPLGDILKSVINGYLHKNRRDLEVQLFAILREIVMDHNLGLLHSEDAFKDFVKSLPALLLEKQIYDSTIQMLNRVVLQYRQWIQKELEKNHDAIIGMKQLCADNT